MRCCDSSEQVFNLKDTIIAIDWGKNGDKSIKTTVRKEKDGTFTLTECKELGKVD